MLDTPILFIIFNRPDTTLLVLDAIKKAKPRALYIAADGPRATKEGEAKKCDEARTIVLNSIDWECKVSTLFRDTNWGCKMAVSSAIDWFFEHEEQGIILEDDCLPHFSFFPYCEELLNKYKQDTRVMHISGTNFLFQSPGYYPYSYYFSKYISIWGWATWRRAWKLYDRDVAKWPEYKSQGILKNVLPDKIEHDYFSHFFDKLYSNEFDTWDLQWLFTNFFQHSASISPTVNLVSNIGFREDATHTHSENQCANVKTEAIGNSILHPSSMVTQEVFDRLNFNISYNGYQLRKSKTVRYKLSRLIYRIECKLKSYLPK